MAELKPGDRVTVDISGIYLGFCHGCDSSTLAVPGGGCPCGASADKVEWLRDIKPDDWELPYSSCCNVRLERPDPMYGDPTKDWYCPGCDDMMLRSEEPVWKKGPDA